MSDFRRKHRTGFFPRGQAPSGLWVPPLHPGCVVAQRPQRRPQQRRQRQGSEQTRLFTAALIIATKQAII